MKAHINRGWVSTRWLAKFPFKSFRGEIESKCLQRSLKHVSATKRCFAGYLNVTSYENFPRKDRISNFMFLAKCKDSYASVLVSRIATFTTIIHIYKARLTASIQKKDQNTGKISNWTLSGFVCFFLACFFCLFVILFCFLSSQF